MSTKKKRKRYEADLSDAQSPRMQNDYAIQHALLGHYYPQVLNLREYILSKIPPKLKIKRIKSWSKSTTKNNNEIPEIMSLLDHMWIGVNHYKTVSEEEKQKQWSIFTQKSIDFESHFKRIGPEASQSKVDAVHKSEIPYTNLLDRRLRCLAPALQVICLRWKESTSLISRLL